MSCRRYIVLSLNMMERCKVLRSSELRSSRLGLSQHRPPSLPAQSSTLSSIDSSEYEIAQKDISGVIEADVFFLPR
jgi:hypothetical protein